MVTDMSPGRRNHCFIIIHGDIFACSPSFTRMFWLGCHCESTPFDFISSVFGGYIIYWLHWWVVLSLETTGVTCKGNPNWEIAFIRLTCEQVYGGILLVNCWCGIAPFGQCYPWTRSLSFHSSPGSPRRWTLIWKPDKPFSSPRLVFIRTEEQGDDSFQGWAWAQGHSTRQQHLGDAGWGLTHFYYVVQVRFLVLENHL